MGSFWPLLVSLLMSFTAIAQTEQVDFSYKGQESEAIELKRLLVETRTRTEVQDTTCTRDVDYQDQECEDVTRYRQECEWHPGYQDCSQTRQDYQCRTVTRYREECASPGNREVCRDIPGRRVCSPGPDVQECTQGPDRKECSPGPTRRECTRGPSRQDCSQGPSRQECTQGPDRKVCDGPAEPCGDLAAGQRRCRPGQTSGEGQCRIVPGERTCRTVPGERTCRDIPGEERCRDVPGEQVCRIIPGEQRCRRVPGPEICRETPSRRECDTVPLPVVCRNIPYNDQDCGYVTVPDCRNIPGENVCESVPYTDQDCRTVTRTRTEEYTCQETVQVPYEVEIPMTAKVDVKFIKPTFEIEEVPMALFLNPERQVEVLSASLEKIVIGALPAAPVVKDENGEILLTQKVDVKFVKEETLSTQLVLTVTAAKYNTKKESLAFTVKGKVDATDLLNLVIEGKNGDKVGKVELSGKPADIKAKLGKLDRGIMEITVDLKGVDVKALKDMKTFKLIVGHTKNMAEGFIRIDEGELKSVKEAELAIVNQ